MVFKGKGSINDNRFLVGASWEMMAAFTKAGNARERTDGKGSVQVEK